MSSSPNAAKDPPFKRADARSVCRGLFYGVLVEAVWIQIHRNGFKKGRLNGQYVHYYSSKQGRGTTYKFSSGKRKIVLCLDNKHILGGDQGYISEILTTAGDLELEVNEDDIEVLIMGNEDELTTEELQEILNEEHQETQRNVSPSEQEEDERGPMPTSAIKDLLKKWVDVRAMVLEWHLNQADVSRVGDLYNNNAINYF
ncbi:uncharacterized protein TNCV_1172851 [Trichonephila clavipes]|uniref:Uncharacterized protein n=1 Tax=Trichonephila clavipes TaxID=2585209 RepID=A0A8X6S5M2_TRICX|nr:uncharacterized protein TNCV_1172851 [Trichonephila clavipes]